MIQGTLDPYYIMEVLADLLGRQDGCVYEIVRAPQGKPAAEPAGPAGG